MNPSRTFLLSCLVILFVAPLCIAAPADSSLKTPILGAAWYPEQWPEARWEADLTLMQQAGIHMVRVGEFAWSRMEPSEGQYDLDWLERAIAAAARHNISTVIGTPTPAPPAWLTQKYPETLRTLEDGRKDQHGNRQQFNWANPKYRELTRKIAEQLATSNLPVHEASSARSKPQGCSTTVILSAVRQQPNEVEGPCVGGLDLQHSEELF